MKAIVATLLLAIPLSAAAEAYGVLYEDRTQVIAVDLDHVMQMPSGARQAWLVQIDKGQFVAGDINGILMGFDCRRSGLVQHLGRSNYQGTGRLAQFSYDDGLWIQAGSGTPALGAWEIVCSAKIPAPYVRRNTDPVTIYQKFQPAPPPVLSIPDPQVRW